MKTSHCSAAVAAVAGALGAALPAPAACHRELYAPEAYLASRQLAWLRRPCDFNEAQRCANAGCVVVAAVPGLAECKAGHIVLVRPGSATVLEDILCLQVGKTNLPRTLLSEALRSHANFPEAARFFAHASVYAALPAPLSRPAPPSARDIGASSADRCVSRQQQEGDDAIGGGGARADPATRQEGAEVFHAASRRAVS